MQNETDEEAGHPADTEKSAARAAGKSTLQSVDKALRVLMLLADAGSDGMGLQQMSSDLAMNKSSLHSTVSALRFRGFVTQSEETRRYYLGPTISALSQRYMRSYDIRAILRPALLRLSEQINEVCHVAVLDGTDVVYVDKTESQRPIQAGTRIGMRLPAINTALGRAMVAVQHDDFDSFARRFEGTLEIRTANTPRTIEAAWERIQQTRQRGYGLDLQENVEGLVAIGIAIVNDAIPVAAVSIVALASEVGPDGPVRYLDALKQTVQSRLQAPLSIFEP